MKSDEERAMNNKKGSQIAEWGIAFAVVVAVGAMSVVPLKRALHSKAVATTDYVLWNQWGNTPVTQAPEATSRAKSTGEQEMHTILNEKHDGSITYRAENTQTQTMVSAGVEEGREAELERADANALFE